MKDDPVGAFEVDGGGFDPADALIHLPYCYGRKKKKKSTQQAILKLKILLLSFSVFRLRSKKRHTGTEKCGDILNTMKPHCKQTTLLRKMKKQSNAYAENRKKKIRWKQRQKKKKVWNARKKKRSKHGKQRHSTLSQVSSPSQVAIHRPSLRSNQTTHVRIGKTVQAASPHLSNHFHFIRGFRYTSLLHNCFGFFG